MAAPDSIASHLASAFLMGRWEVESLVERGADALGRRWRWLRPLARRLIQSLGQNARPGRHRVVMFLRSDEGFQRACRRHDLRLEGLQRGRPEMAPAAGAPRTWELPSIVTFGELADWLDVDPSELDWFADLRGLERNVASGPLRNYRYHWLSKRVAGSARLIESPKARLKAIQRRILHHILDRIPPHRAAHGFTRGRSIKTFVAPHAGRSIVLRADLADFFPAVSKARAIAALRTAGYPEEVCQVLAALCTNQVPDGVWRSFPQFGNQRDRWRHEGLYRRPHLPQGAPTSPALANLCSFRLDCRLEGLARTFDANYTRYADDLLFSGGPDLARDIRRFYAIVCAVASDEGFRVNFRKTRIMSPADRQCAAGLVLNEHPNVRRDSYDRLKATLHNCVRHGAASQNRAGAADFRAHLHGRIAFIESVTPARGHKLRVVFDRIDWSGL
jgi:RNA-directed DNA polymerase